VTPKGPLRGNYLEAGICVCTSLQLLSLVLAGSADLLYRKIQRARPGRVHRIRCATKLANRQGSRQPWRLRVRLLRTKRQVERSAQATERSAQPRRCQYRAAKPTARGS